MNKSMTNTNNCQAELEQLIERYFEGETSLQEEQILRQMLADCTWQSDTIDEARFALGYFVAHQRQQGQQKQPPRASISLRYMAIAASVALLLALGGGLLWHNWQHNNVCIAYVNGKVVEDNDKVMALVANDMSIMDNASNAITNQLSSLGEALELDNE